MYANIYADDLNVVSYCKKGISTGAGVESDFQDELYLRIVEEILDEKVALL